MPLPVYLDCAATTPLDPRVRDEVVRVLDEEFGNAGSRTHERGQRARAAVERNLHPVAMAHDGEGAWRPLWFGNEQAPDERSPVYGTSRVLAAVARLPAVAPALARARARGLGWLIGVQNADGGWGGARGVASSIEETGVALQAVARCAGFEPAEEVRASAARAVVWLGAATSEGHAAEAAPIGLYFARLWYYEELHPIVFALAGLSDARRAWG
jgi:squalene-hopene/tetraprenyl-beta-curcumene cyclase